MTSVLSIAINQGTDHAPAGGSSVESRPWTFSPVPRPTLPSNTAENITKWGLKDCIRTSRFAFDKKFQAYDAADFLKCLFTDPCVKKELEMCTRRGTWVPLQALGNSVNVEHEVVDTTWVNLDPLFAFRGGPVRDNDMIVKCFDETYEGIVVSDELRKVFLAEDESDYYDLFSDEEKGELLYRLLGHLVIGGPLNQYEDSFKPYIDSVRDIYKSLVKVVRNDNKELSIVSHCYKVRLSSTEQNGPQFFPSRVEHPQDFCYVSIDPITRWVTLLYGAWDD